MLHKSKKIVLEKDIPFSKSLLWGIERDFFEKEKMKAWQPGVVPFYITSNPTIANMYSQIVIGLARDWLSQGRYQPDQPIYLIEVGTGPGRFSFYMVKRLIELQKALKLDGVKFKYVMTDFAQGNLDSWKKHPQIQSLMDHDILDFALYDATCSNELHLVNTNQTFKKGDLKNPIIAFANYLFDAVPHDAFHVENGRLQEATLRTETLKNNLKKGKIIDNKKLHTQFEYRDIKSDHYYSDPHLNNILAYYQNHLKHKTTFLIPIVGIQCMNTLRTISNNQFLLITSDKAYSYLEEIDGLNDPTTAFHGDDGCFSMMVNFHAVGEYFKACGGEAFIPTIRTGMKTCVFTTGLPELKALPNTNLAIETHINQFGPSDFFQIHTHMKASKDDCDLKILGAHMNLCGWDPHIFDFFSQRIREAITSTELKVRQMFLKRLPRVMDNFYLMPNNQDVPFGIALIYHSVEDYQKALDYYKLSIHYFGQNFSSLYNAGLCAYLLDQFKQSLDFFKQAHNINKTSKETEEWIATVEKLMLSQNNQ